jgi:hypothetical protein
MRRPKPLFAASLFTLMILLSASLSVVRADDEDVDTDEYDVTARVVRTSLLEGQVDLRRAGNKAWEQARLNLPLVEGDTLATGRDARIELQIDAHNFVRIGADSLLRIVTLRSEGIVLSLVEGTATVRLARFDRQREYFEIDMPKTTMSVEQTGLYRLDVARDGGLHLTVRDGGRARVYTNADGFTLRDERTATLTYAGGTEGDWQFSAAAPFDTWDTWVNDRERYLAGRLRYEQRDRYYDADIWGAEELDAYGDWVYADNYGWVWRPHTAVTNSYNDWAPYRHGHWRWCPPYGWTWVGDEPWGWAPYHYGRWVYYNHGWCWAPRGYGFRYSRNWWRPALVAFVYVPSSYGEHIAWYPLTYGQHDPHRRNHRPRSRPGRLSPLRGSELNSLRRINPAMARAVTTVPVREFGIEGARLRPATTAIARNAINTEPVRARLPVAPRASDQTGAGAAARDTRSGRLPAARPATLVPAAALSERPTGAAAREPGVPLDDELWRTRVYQGRQPRPPRAPATGAGTDPANRDTGAVARPALPATRPPLDAGDTDDVDRNYRNNVPSGTRPTLPARPSRPPTARDEDRPPASPDENLTPAPVDERPPARPPRTAEPPTPPAETTTPLAESPEIFNPPPARPERPAPPERDMPVARPASPETRPAPPERREAPAPPQPEQVSRPEPSRPEPARPEPPAPPREEPPPPPAEPAQREETPSPPPPAPDPPPSAPDPPPAPAPEPQREAPSPPPDRTPEEDRARPPLG